MKLTTAKDVQELLNSLKGEKRRLMKEVYTIAWHMRGGVSREEALSLSYDERVIISKFIEERTKIVEKTGLALL